MAAAQAERCECPCPHPPLTHPLDSPNLVSLWISTSSKVLSVYTSVCLIFFVMGPTVIDILLCVYLLLKYFLLQATYNPKRFPIVWMVSVVLLELSLAVSTSGFVAIVEVELPYWCSFADKYTQV